MHSGLPFSSVSMAHRSHWGSSIVNRSENRLVNTRKRPHNAPKCLLTAISATHQYTIEGTKSGLATHEIWYTLRSGISRAQPKVHGPIQNDSPNQWSHVWACSPPSQLNLSEVSCPFLETCHPVASQSLLCGLTPSSFNHTWPTSILSEQDPQLGWTQMLGAMPGHLGPSLHQDFHHQHPQGPRSCSWGHHRRKATPCGSVTSVPLQTSIHMDSVSQQPPLPCTSYVPVTWLLIGCTCS